MTMTIARTEPQSPERRAGSIRDSLIGAQHDNQADGREHRGEVEEAKLGGEEEG